MDASHNPEVQRFEEMLRSLAWKTYSDRVQAELRRAVVRCVGELDDVELRRAQGAAAALQAMLDLPAVILAGMKKK